MPQYDDIINHAFRQIDLHKKVASIAEVGGFRPSGDPLASKFSGDFVMMEHEEWPHYDGRHLQSFLQINITELPYTPPTLEHLKMITIFVDENQIPFNKPNGHGWELRCYTDTHSLLPRMNPIRDSDIKPFEIRWTMTEDEGPHWEDAWTIADLNAFNQLPDAIDLFYDRYSNQCATKVGGWPFLAQHDLSMKSTNYVLQIASEPKANWQWIDRGIAYFGIIDGEWKFECQFY